MNVFTIKDVELLTNIKAHTIRIWEQRYSFLKPKRTVTNIRYYDAEELRSVLNISLLSQHGLRISEINKMDQSAVNNQIHSLESPEAKQNRALNELIILMTNLQIDGFEWVIDQYTHENGIHKTISELMLPFTERIAIFWLNGNDIKAQQQLISNVLRQKMLYAINNLERQATKNKTIILFLPEDEHYELGLLYLSYLAKRNGMNTVYLGADLPLADLLSVAKFKSPDFIVTHLNSRNPSFEKFLPKYQQHLPNIPLLVSTHSNRSVFKKFPPSVVQEKHFTDMPTFFNSISPGFEG